MSGGKSPRHAQNNSPCLITLTSSSVYHLHACISGLHCFYRITVSRKRPLVLKSDVILVLLHIKRPRMAGDV